MDTASISELLVTETSSDGILSRLLTAIGAEFRLFPIEEIFSDENAAKTSDRALILSEEQLIAAYKSGLSRERNLRYTLASFQSVLIFPFAATPVGLQVLDELAGVHFHLQSFEGETSEYLIQDSRKMTGAFSGLSFGPINRTYDRPLVADVGNNLDFIVTAGGAGLFTRFRIGKCDVFVNSCARVFDVSTEYKSNLQVAECFSSLVPLMFFLRHSRASFPQVTQHWANWIIDDPNLTPQYGFLRTQELADCVRRIGAAATIAFIPWNYKRTTAKVVNLFRAEAPRLSICYHGCDHTGSEFVTATDSDALQLGKAAIRRMNQLEAKTLLPCEKVMVFPQGRFSKEAMCGLRQSDFLGAVNTELVDRRTGKGVEGGQLLRPAITTYGGFPLFMRRTAEQPIANFALDLFLGKPCLIVAHHQYFRFGMQPLASLVESITRLDPDIMWTNLERGITTTYTVRRNRNGTVNVGLYCSCTHLLLDEPSGSISLSKSEPMFDSALRVFWNEQEIYPSFQDNELKIEGEQLAGKQIKVTVLVPPSLEPEVLEKSASDRVKVALRRYLSEFRDNYVDRSVRISAGIASLRNLMARRRRHSVIQ